MNTRRPEFFLHALDMKAVSFVTSRENSKYFQSFPLCRGRPLPTTCTNTNTNSNTNTARASRKYVFLVNQFLVFSYFRFSNQLSPYKKDSIIIGCASPLMPESDRNSHSQEFSWESASFFLARPWEIVFNFSSPSRNTRLELKNSCSRLETRDVEKKFPISSRKTRFSCKFLVVFFCQ